MQTAKRQLLILSIATRALSKSPPHMPELPDISKALPSCLKFSGVGTHRHLREPTIPMLAPKYYQL